MKITDTITTVNWPDDGRVFLYKENSWVAVAFHKDAPDAGVVISPDGSSRPSAHNLEQFAACAATGDTWVEMTFNVATGLFHDPRNAQSLTGVQTKVVTDPAKLPVVVVTWDEGPVFRPAADKNYIVGFREYGDRELMNLGTGTIVGEDYRTSTDITYVQACARVDDGTWIRYPALSHKFVLEPEPSVGPNDPGGPGPIPSGPKLSRFFAPADRNLAMVVEIDPASARWTVGATTGRQRTYAYTTASLEEFVRNGTWIEIHGQDQPELLREVQQLLRDRSYHDTPATVGSELGDDAW